MQLTVSNAGSGPLAFIEVFPAARENSVPLYIAVRTLDSVAAGNPKVRTGNRLRSKHLMVPDSTSNRDYQAAVRDTNGMWSEWSAAKTVATANNSVGAASTNASIGQLSTDSSDVSLEEPGIAFPDLQLGSHQGFVNRTILSEGFTDEVRRVKWAKQRAMFHCVFNNLDESQALLISRWYRALNGPWKPFIFHFKDAMGNEDAEREYVVRFSRPDMMAELFDVDRSNIEFDLIEVMGVAEGDVE